MIVVDGRTDREKLRELLQFGEQQQLDFKAKLNLKIKRDELNFVKDAVAMSNRHPGGYLLIGVDDDGKPVMKKEDLQNPELFDSANLGNIVRKYIEGQIHFSSQIHDYEGHVVIVIFVASNKDGLPTPMSQDGQYQNAKNKPVPVFRKGDIFVREGSQNTHLRFAHWADLLAHRDSLIRAQAREGIDKLATELASVLQSVNIDALLPLDINMSLEAFRSALSSHLGSTNDVPLHQFLMQAQTLASSTEDPAEQNHLLDQITLIATESIISNKIQITNEAITALQDIYDTVSSQGPEILLSIISRIYIIGSIAVRLKRWQILPDLILNPHPRTSGHYIYPSWIRHAQVTGSNNNRFDTQNEPFLLISRARQLATDHPQLRPDILDAALPEHNELKPADPLLNSLCQFDFLYALITTVEGQHASSAYPTVYMLNQARIDPILHTVSTDEHARKKLFPTANNQTIAKKLKELHNHCYQHSWGSGGNWHQLPPSAETFITENT